MEKLQILTYPHPFLKKVADPVPLDSVNDTFRKMIDEMFQLMYKSHGGGLAATQVGLNLRFFIMDGSKEKNQRLVVINPEILETKDEVYEEEGCLSFPGVSAKVKRARWVKMKAYNALGEHYTLETDGYLGRCIQHELDHLNGITYFDHLSPLKRKMIEKKYQKLVRENSKN